MAVFEVLPQKIPPLLDLIMPSIGNGPLSTLAFYGLSVLSLLRSLTEDRLSKLDRVGSLLAHSSLGLGIIVDVANVTVCILVSTKDSNDVHRIILWLYRSIMLYWAPFLFIMPQVALPTIMGRLAVLGHHRGASPINTVGANLET